MIYTPHHELSVKSRILRWAGHVAHMVERQGAYSVLVRKPEGKETKCQDLGVEGM
jgi:hypothetical protein